MIVVTAIATAYLLGSIPFALIVGKMFGIKDIRQAGSGNLGATNVWRQAGAVAGILVLILDVAKGAAAVMLARWLISASATGTTYDLIMVTCAMVAVIGHVFPIYLKFRGGKGVATGLGVMLSLLPAATGVALLVFVLVVVATRFVSLGSILAGIALSGYVLTAKYACGTNMSVVYVALAILLALLVVWTHRQNIRRLVAGQENRLSFSGGGRE